MYNKKISNHIKYNKIEECIKKYTKIYDLENLNFIKKNNNDLKLCVLKRRNYYENKYNLNFSKIPISNFNYKEILNKNCENVIGYVKVPIGIVGPIKITNFNLKKKKTINYHVPIATSEGALVASINRGTTIINNSSIENINCITIDKGITRAPIIKVNSLDDIILLKLYIQNNHHQIKKKFESTTKYGKFEKIEFYYNGLYVHLRISAITGNAMGMNIITKGTEEILNHIIQKFPNFKVISLSGNMCTDKKPSAINWINGRSKTVICNTKLDIDLLKKYSKINIDDLINLNLQKNLIGSALAGSIGGFNAHSANIIAGIFLATGQDLGQIGTSSVSITDYYIEKNLLNISLTMPCLEVATIGGGTSMTSQQSCINLLNLNENNTNSSILLSQIIASTVLCGELSLMISLTKGNLVNSHMKLNRGL